MDRLHAMRVFTQVIEAGSFAGAARKLNLPPPVVTRLVADLEEHLGTRLINRTTRRLALTEAGENYLDRVRLILADVEDAEAQASSDTAAPRGPVRVLMPPAFATHQLARHLPTFRHRHPLVSVEIVANGPVDTMDETFDVTIIASTEPLSGDFVARPLARSEVVVCASPDYLKKMGRPRHPSDVVRHDVLIPPMVRELIFHPVGSHGHSTGVESIRLGAVRPVLSTTHIDTMYAAALAGLGVAGLPSFVVAQALRDQTLERVLPDWHLLSSTIYAAIPTRKHVPARTRVFLDFLVEVFGGQGSAKDPWQQVAH